jgi:hypothetical protein
MFCCPVVFSSKALLPKATLLVPEVLRRKADGPKATLLDPSVFAF